MNSRRAVIAVMAKRPTPGEVKTRMCPPLEPSEAAEFYAAMLEDVVRESQVAASQAGADLWLLVHPPSAVEELGRRCPPGATALPQRGPDLASRMQSAVAQAAAAGFDRILLRGSDSPAITADALVEGLAALEDADLAVGPDSDGGYAWIALRRPQPGLFDHPMSTETVLEDTLANAAGAGLRVRRMAREFDLDTVADLALLEQARQRGAAQACPRTLALLDARGHWGHAKRN